MATQGFDMDGSLAAHCAECYRALFAGCRSADLGALPAERQLWQLTVLVSAYACSAREARKRPDVVLSDLRRALEPLSHSPSVPVELLMHRATTDYYGVYPH